MIPDGTMVPPDVDSVNILPGHTVVEAGEMTTGAGTGLTLTVIESFATQPLDGPPEISEAVTTYLVVAVGDTEIELEVDPPGDQLYV